MLTVFARTLIIYIILLIAMRFVGKRQIGELQVSELITTLMLSELAVLPIGNADIPLLYAILPILTLLSLEIIISFTTSHLPLMRKYLYGTPSILIHRGKLNIREMDRLRMDIGELLSELRLKDISDVSDVQCAILEDNGKLSVFKKTSSAPVSQGTEETPGERGVSLPVIISGHLMHSAMHYAGVDEPWVRAKLKKHRLTQGDILLMAVDEQKKTVYILKNDEESPIREVDES